ncbi:hypothetical protein [Pelagicoccus sp. SDUM812005]|uniref:hypothetical protein n=1 Tax=Pelagicoccus sp. SDUM812005 TaxID=3041257 RepID=UPI00280E1257|nr:hypothetical protein [Pelagicoccus sp. SDUM812005]MDQ8180164.1 hypothetical protein [Pelagicoccus sp. SDUM812005]
MKTIKTLLIGSVALAASAVSTYGEGLLGQRYASLSLGTDEDFNELAVSVGFNTKLKDGLDLYFEVGESDDGDVVAGMLDLKFYGDVGTEENWKVYFAPIVGYASIDLTPWWNERELVYGVGIGSQYELDEKSNIDLTLSFLDTQDYGDLGVTGTFEYNYWLTEKLNAGVGVSYNTEVEETAFQISGRWAF